MKYNSTHKRDIIHFPFVYLLPHAPHDNIIEMCHKWINGHNGYTSTFVSCILDTYILGANTSGNSISTSLISDLKLWPV